ncbi:MAG: DEAD/DEAH box helicase family protein [Firmicutes bacterium]|nr:DEAD/DEAH box helicase family protein [Bacillota bacterium]
MLGGKLFCCLDLETTGVFPQYDEIIEIGAVRLEEGRLTERFSTLVKPSRQIPAHITRLTGITNLLVADAPSFAEVIPDLLDFIGEAVIIGHQVSFDLSFLTKHLGYPLPNPTIDTLELARLVWPALRNYKLQTLAGHLGLCIAASHRALVDAEMAGEVFLAGMRALQAWEYGLLQKITRLGQDCPWTLSRLLVELEAERRRNFMVGRWQHKQVFLSVRSEEVGLFERREARARVEADPAEPLDPDQLAKLLEPNGLLSQRPNYEFRPEQVRMLRQIVAAFNEEKFLVIEAGTGTGKSLAYLLPAIYQATLARTKVVVSTHTITLQEQLWAKDLPFLQSVLPIKFSAAMVKGRSNYVCLRRWFELEENLLGSSPEERKNVLRLMSWLAQTRTGDRAELLLSQDELDTWQLIAAEKDACLGSKCPWFKHYCFVMRARRQADQADILVVNHSLLLTDLKADSQVLPAYEYLIVDEAHHLEEAATENLGVSVGFSELINFCSSLSRSERVGNPGWLHNVRQRLSRLPVTLDRSDRATLDKLIDRAITVVSSVRTAAQEFFNLLAGIARERLEHDEMSNYLTWRIRPTERKTDWYQAWLGMLNNLDFQIASLVDALRQLRRFLEGLPGAGDSLVGEIWDIQGQLTFLDEYRQSLVSIVTGEDCGVVNWVELEEKEDWTNCWLRSAPIEVGDLLNQYLFCRLKSAVFTSATLTVDKKFDHFLDNLGLTLLPSERLITGQIESPFHYDQQVLLCIPRDLPNPAEVDDEEFAEAVVPFLSELLTLTEGRTIVLFTSHRMLRNVYSQLKPILEARNIILLGHNIDGNQSRLVEELRQVPRTVVFGASSLWEGVDIQGENLSCVVIVKLPFWPPSIPRVEARLEVLAEKARNGFLHFTVPQAVIRLKQGFGRLIRSAKDRGTVVILDKRLIEKRYGRIFLNSLPIQTHIRGESAFILRKVKDWFAPDELADYTQLKK